MRLIFWIFLAVWVCGFLLHMAAIYNWFGRDTEAMALVLVLPLGAPWNMLSQRYWIDSTAMMMLAPAINFTILYLIALGTEPRGRRK